MSLIATLSVTNLTQCVLELILNSLSANATSIAVRLDVLERKIQVVDNGTGIPKNTLKNIAEYCDEKLSEAWNVQNASKERQRTLMNIRSLSNAMMITSRSHDSSKAYMKIFRVHQAPRVVRVEPRPSHGTTVSIYGFHELSTTKQWDVSLMYISIANIALDNPKVSLSIRDDRQGRVLMSISKRHSSTQVLRLLRNIEVSFNHLWYLESDKNCKVQFHAYIGLAKEPDSQYIFLNYRPVHCPVILTLMSTTFTDFLHSHAKEHRRRLLRKEAVFILLFIRCSEFVLTIENGRKTLVLPKIQDLLESIRDSILNISLKNSIAVRKRTVIHKFYNIVKRKVTKIETQKTCTPQNVVQNVNNIESQRKVAPSANVDDIIDVDRRSPTPQSKTLINDNYTLSISQWSDWSYHENKEGDVTEKVAPPQINIFADNTAKRFSFLPDTLCKLLPPVNSKLTRTNLLSGSGTSLLPAEYKTGLPVPDVLRHQEMDVRLCKSVQQFFEFRLRKDHLKSVKILAQVNNELIAGLIINDNTKVLVLMDQHALHERIRYENLLDKYRSQRRGELVPIKLRDPVALQFPTEVCKLLWANKILLKRFGINLNCVKDNAIMVRSVPECLKTNKHCYNELRIKLRVESLLNEIVENLQTTNGHCKMDNLPFTIQNAIATEACHGAIKFGDPLTLKQCKWLVKLLQNTRIPTRCAHGRPSIIPVLDLSELEKKHRKVVQKNT